MKKCGWLFCSDDFWSHSGTLAPRWKRVRCFPLEKEHSAGWAWKNSQPLTACGTHRFRGPTMLDEADEHDDQARLTAGRTAHSCT
jgi:hypothetical protein